jgi:hypothetical protein
VRCCCSGVRLDRLEATLLFVLLRPDSRHGADVVALGAMFGRRLVVLFAGLLLHDPQHALLSEFATCHDVTALFGSHAGLVDAPSSQA